MGIINTLCLRILCSFSQVDIVEISKILESVKKYGNTKSPNSYIESKANKPNVLNSFYVSSAEGFELLNYNSKCTFHDIDISFGLLVYLV